MASTRGIKTAWRNAACLMMLTGPFRYTRQPALALGSHNSTLNCLEAHPPSASSPSLSSEILFVQRHSKSGFMANTHVFPGGVLDEADYSSKWLDLFTESEGCKQPFSSILALRQRCTQQRLPIYSQVVSGGPILGEVAFRICAIRECFEEAGILLARNRNDVASKLDLVPGTFNPSIMPLSDSVREEWRERVHENAQEFLTMCRELHCVPDIWSLIEWSDWLTPRNYKRRYDTMFYMCFSENKPTAMPDKGEVINTKWMSPSEADRLFSSGEVFLAPPQFAELKTLQSFPSIPILHSFALEESLHQRVLQKNSVRILTKDSVILSVTEQDDLYPMEGCEDWTTEIQHPQAAHLRNQNVILTLSQHIGYEHECHSHTADELRELSENFRRMEFRSKSDFRFDDNNIINKIANHTKRYQDQHVNCKRQESKL